MNDKAYWCDGSAVKTHFFDAWSILFPAWEKVFAFVAEHHKQFINDEQLKARIDTFVKEELSHANAHHAHNEKLELFGFEQEQYNKAKIAFRRPQSRMWLATMVSIEHLAVCFARWYLPNFNNETSKQHKMFAWHSVQEIGHKSLAMDIWIARGYDKALLKKVCIANQKYVWKFVLLYVFQKLKAENQLLKPKTYIDFIIFGASVFKGIYLPSLKVFDKNFHPDQTNDSKYLEVYA
jgi:predicted metal-dependent hydrolase